MKTTSSSARGRGVERSPRDCQKIRGVHCSFSKPAPTTPTSSAYPTSSSSGIRWGADSRHAMTCDALGWALSVTGTRLASLKPFIAPALLSNVPSTQTSP